MADFILLDEDFSDFPIGEFPYDKNHSAMGEYHFIHYPGYYGKWYDPVCNHVYNGQGASWIISEYNGKHFMEQMRIRNDKPHRTFGTKFKLTRCGRAVNRFQRCKKWRHPDY